MPGCVSVAVHDPRSAESITRLAPKIAIRCPRTVTRYGAYAAAAFSPMPTVGNPLALIAASVSPRPSAPKSRPWLLAIVTTSTPAAANAVNALAGARNVNAFGSGDPRVVIDVSRFTIVMSAWAITGAIGASTVFGSAASRFAAEPSNCVSPAKRNVTCSPFPFHVRSSSATARVAPDA